jgi:4'-phosphopantetheinyl transferase
VEDTWGPLTAPRPGALPEPGVCHLWATSTEGAASHLALLDPQERVAAERFRLASAKDAFVASRVAQRLVIGSYLQRPPEAITIARDCRHCGKQHGRPYVPGAAVDFSVSHSAGWLLLAVVADGVVGVDLEQVSGRPVDDLANRVLGPAEQQQFLLVPHDQRPGWFIWAWARKEATLKLTGHGIAGPLSGLDVTGSIAVVSAPPSGWPAEPIHLRDIPAAAPDLHAAVATTVPLTAVITCGPALGM